MPKKLQKTLRFVSLYRKKNSIYLKVWTVIKLPPADEKVSVAEIEEIIIKYNTTNVITCDQRPGYVKSGLDIVFALSGCFVIFAIILLIFLFIRW